MAEWNDLGRVPQWSLRIDPSLTKGLPTDPNTWSAEGAREFLWLGPDEWLVIGGEPDALNGHYSIVDVSANRRVIQLTGDDRLELLSQGCGVDLHPQSWRAGMCAQTLLAHVPVILQERANATRVFVRPSLEEWLKSWVDAANTSRFA
jgi:sarcosine oxidase subunit gamma